MGAINFHRSAFMPFLPCFYSDIGMQLPRQNSKHHRNQYFDILALKMGQISERK
jgi:hypothetical protein